MMACSLGTPMARMNEETINMVAKSAKVGAPMKKNRKGQLTRNDNALIITRARALWRIALSEIQPPTPVPKRTGAL